jgi:hypothetical protein
MKESSVAVSGFTHALELLRGRITAGFALVGRTAIFPGIDWCGYSSGHRYGAHGKGSCPGGIRRPGWSFEEEEMSRIGSMPPEAAAHRGRS